MSRTAMCSSTILQYLLGSLLGCFVDEIDQFFRSFWRRLRQHPMPQIEHVAGPSSNPCQNLLCTSLYERPVAQERCRVQVALNSDRSEEHTSELQSHSDLVCRLLLEKKKKPPAGEPE